MKEILLVICLLPVCFCHANKGESGVEMVKIPFMNRAALHRAYADDLLRLALDVSEESFGPYEIFQQSNSTVIRRQLQEVSAGEKLNVAISMPMKEWHENALWIPFPIINGLASYRMFFVADEKYGNITNLNSLKRLRIGQGPGWSTGKILEDNGFNVVYGGPYNTLFPMLEAGRFDLLMRGVYEVEPELRSYISSVPSLRVADHFAAYTYLPLYFYVSRKKPELAKRLFYGLRKAYDSGQQKTLFKRYFIEAQTLLLSKKRTVFYLNNSNINPEFFKNDRPYLLPAIIELELNRAR